MTHTVITDGTMQGGDWITQSTQNGYEEELAALLAWLRVEGLGPRGMQQLFKAGAKEGHSPKTLWQASPECLLHLGLTKKQLSSWASLRDQISFTSAVLEPYQQQGITILPFGHPLYPPLLAQIHSAPALLFVKGEPSVLQQSGLAFVGTRKASDYGRYVTEKLIEGLKESPYSIVSGLALGIDGVAHHAALRHNLPTIAVFGCGLDTLYPPSHKKLAEAILEEGGLWVSEYPLGIRPDRFTFPQRNRIIAGLSEGTVIIEGNLKSGALITAKIAMEENRPVFAVPGNLFQENTQAPHWLLQQGATLIQSTEDILAELGHATSKEASQQMTLLQNTAKHAEAFSVPQHLAAVFQHIPFESIDVDHLLKKTALPSATLFEQLALLEIEGLTESLPGNKVRRLEALPSF